MNKEVSKKRDEKVGLKITSTTSEQDSVACENTPKNPYIYRVRQRNKRIRND
tara:strand:+ start:772 stop:927 length:156 start_codon:yes stop_codon:yes gene_type:complete